MTIRVLTIVAAVGAGVAAGVFFAFSTFVMSGLRRLPPAQGMAAMQAINREAPASPWFMVVLFGTAIASVVLAISALTKIGSPASWLLLLGCVLYLACVVVLAVYHVPHNNALDRLDPNAANSPDEWNSYFAGWTAWNHVRTLTALGASALFTTALFTG